MLVQVALILGGCLFGLWAAFFAPCRFPTRPFTPLAFARAAARFGLCWLVASFLYILLWLAPLTYPPDWLAPERPAVPRDSLGLNHSPTPQAPLGQTRPPHAPRAGAVAPAMPRPARLH